MSLKIVVNIVNSPLVLISNVSFSPSASFDRCCKSEGRLGLIFHITTQQCNGRYNRYYKLAKTNKVQNTTMPQQDYFTRGNVVLLT
jgi:hypothetical protein